VGLYNEENAALKYSAELCDFFSLFIYSSVHTLFGHFSPAYPTSSFPLTPPIVEEKTSNNKKDTAFLLVEIRIAIQRAS
jgi:hypothetical protein